MSINNSGMDAKLCGGEVSITVSAEDSLIKLGNMILWKKLGELVLPDLKKTAKGFWWRGRALHVRIHLAVYILQSMFNKTDRAIEQDVRCNALYQIFCGFLVVDAWHVPDATKIEEFRNRLSPSTQHAIGELVLMCAKAAKFTNAKWMDVDSTVQEANIAYPADANLMMKLASKAADLVEEFKGFGKKLSVDAKKIKGKVKEYFFMAKNTAVEKKRQVFAELHKMVSSELAPVFEAARATSKEKIEKLSSRLQILWYQVCDLGPGLLADIRVFIKTHSMVPTKILSLHAKAIACVKKGKLGKPHEFGRVFQLGRIPGNFLLIAKASSLLENDKQALPKMLYQFRRIFGQEKPDSVATDKGYASKKNFDALKRAGVQKIGIQLPSNTKNIPVKLSDEDAAMLRDRRAGIEPLIGHLKHGGFRKSRMKSDQTTEASAYRCTTGFNLRQLIRHIDGCYQ